MSKDPQYDRNLAEQLFGSLASDNIACCRGLIAGFCACPACCAEPDREQRRESGPVINFDDSEGAGDDTIHIMDGGYTALVDGVLLVDLAEPAEVAYDEDGDLVVTLKLTGRSVALD